MNKRFLAFLASVAAFLTAVGGADLAGFISLLPDDWATGFVTILPSLAGVVHFLKIFGDFADDGKLNNSFNGSLKVVPILLWLTLGALSFFTISCGTGTIVKFGEKGIEVIPPATPIVIPVK